MRIIRFVFYLISNELRSFPLLYFRLSVNRLFPHTYYVLIDFQREICIPFVTRNIAFFYIGFYYSNSLIEKFADRKMRPFKGKYILSDKMRRF